VTLITQSLPSGQEGIFARRPGRRENAPHVGNPDRLSALDASFLHLEDRGGHMHVGSCMLLAGSSPPYDDFVAALERRLELVPRYRQRLAFPPWDAGRPVWVDDEHFNLRYHVRHTALPPPAGEPELRRLAGRVLAQRLDRSKPLWELWLVEAVGDDAFALLTKTHHCLVDGVAGVDLASVLLDAEPDAEPPPEPARPWSPRPAPDDPALLGAAWADRALAPVELAGGLWRALARPERAAEAAVGALAGLASTLRAGVGGAPPSPLNVPIGPHRRFAWVRGELATFRAIKAALGGTVNDVVLAAVTGALRAHLERHGHPVEGVELRAMVPVSTRAEAERGALGNRVSAVSAPLPVGVADPVERFEIVHEAMAGLKESGQAVGAEVLTRLAGFAPPTVIAQAARLQARQRFFNVAVTNVPGPQHPLYLMGRRLLAIHPQVPLAANTALGVAVLSYDGAMDFGLISDYDALPDLDRLADGLADAVAELAAAAGVDAGAPARRNGGGPSHRRRRSAHAR
jgi:diacylglycerol O-acyltransferase